MQTLLGSLLALGVMTAPVLARHANTPPADQKPVSSSCHTMQRMADGEWVSIPCEEMGSPAQPQPRPAQAETAGH
jgi:hypothetical protein